MPTIHEASDDPHALQRFVEAQEPVYPAVLAELAAGRKRSHWMWFIFPQASGLGRSETARFYSIGSRDEAAAYLRHPLLGPRLLECTARVLAAGERTGSRSATDVLGSPDDLKLHSSLTLFASMQPTSPSSVIQTSVFHKALAFFFAGQLDPRTVAWLTR